MTLMWEILFVPLHYFCHTWEPISFPLWYFFVPLVNDSDVGDPLCSFRNAKEHLGAEKENLVARLPHRPTRDSLVRHLPYSRQAYALTVLSETVVMEPKR